MDPSTRDPDLFLKIDAAHDAIIMDRLARNLVTKDIPMDPDVFSRLYAIRLSGIHDIATAYKYMRHCQIKAEVIYGAVCRMEDDGTFPDRTEYYPFLGFFQTNSFALYDPIYPSFLKHRNADGHTEEIAAPKLGVVSENFFRIWEARAISQPALMVIRDIITGEKTLYGVNNNSGAYTGDDILDPQDIGGPVRFQYKIPVKAL